MVTRKHTALSLLEKEGSGCAHRWCSGIGLIQLDVSNRGPMSIKALVVDDKLLGFNLLLQFDTIKKLGCVCMTSDGTVSFPEPEQPFGTVITISKPDFHAEYDQNRRIWVVS